jgi:flagellar hook-associated protein 1 FlgK
MATTSTFSALNVARGGLNTSQTMVDVTSKNIANAEDAHYTRQRVVSGSLPYRTSKDKWHLEISGGVKSINIERVHDEFVFQRHRKALTAQEEAAYLKDSLKHISNYFPEVDGFGLSNELDKYFNSWTNLITNPSESANKVALASSADRLAETIKFLRSNIKDYQETIDNEIDVYADEINQITKEIAHINSEIFRAAEDQKRVNNNVTPLNELRDRRDELELTLSKIVNIEVDKGVYTGNSVSAKSVVESGADYVLSVSGFSLVDGTGHSEVITRSNSSTNNFVDLKFVRSDHREFNMGKAIHSGKIGAIFKLRGTNLKDSKDGFEDGILQRYLDDLDSFTKTLIEETNSIYSGSATDKLRSDRRIFNDLNRTIVQKIPEVNKGSFFIQMFDIDEKIMAKKEIFIDDQTTMQNILDQINSNNDDNNDSAPSNDIDDKFEARMIDNAFYIESKKASGKYKISINDNGTNFAGALGLNRFFDGNNASNIQLSLALQDNPETISPYYQNDDGKQLIANKMSQLRYEHIDFKTKQGDVVTTLGDFLTKIITQVSSDGAVAIDDFETKDTIAKQIKAEFNAIGKVSVDEELIDLMRFQAGYSANAKVISTIDEMLQTVLGLKK